MERKYRVLVGLVIGLLLAIFFIITSPPMGGTMFTDNIKYEDGVYSINAEFMPRTTISNARQTWKLYDNNDNVIGTFEEGYLVKNNYFANELYGYRVPIKVKNNGTPKYLVLELSNENKVQLYESYL